MSSNPNAPSQYEMKALQKIHDWKHPEKGILGKVADIVSWPIDKAGEAVMQIPGVEWVIEKSVSGIICSLNDVACWSVRPDAICEEYRKAGCIVNCFPSDLFRHDLEHLDKVVGFLAAKYKLLAASEGAAAGTLGLPGIPADVVALTLLCQRAIGEYATYYGFDVSLQQERLFALNILGYASSPTDAAKQAAMAQLIKIAQDVAAKRTWNQLNQQAFVQMIRKICETFGVRLTKAKLAEIVPVVGIAIGGGFNAYFMNKVCDSAFYLYRERFLAQKYGASLIEK